ncbi:pyridoxal phosphate-dependent aminotransferase [Clostridium sp. JN-1]|uniref:pyridoxal phosphate-dependent aminotransferase n=1 Tax=Clostridium sp. JN-1 TaxID=2483110 RepID=UPI000F0BBB5C|nr:pyridoxal phosphate-dependent aminotransferase [Clostridium sp. JN-1]
MVSEKMYELGSKESTIRAISEYGKKRASIVGQDNIFDFSLGNPNVPAPKYIKKAIIDILNTEDPCSVHGYTAAPGDLEVRKLIAESLNKRFETSFSAKNLFMTNGATASISTCFKALSEPEDEFIVFAPYFPEYKCFVEAAGAKLIVVPANINDFQVNFSEFEKKINKNTKAVIVNSPNNPSGVVYSEKTIIKLVNILREKEKEYNHPIFLISDEPYREIAYDNIQVPYLTKYYNNTLVCYSYSKSFSLPGERIGYIVIPNEIINFDVIFNAISGAARVLTHVNAPSLFQKVVAKCAGMPSDISIYEKNKDLLYNGLIKAGFSCVKPEGAFYLFPQSLEEDDAAFCERAKKYDLLLVPGRDFGCPGHFRAAYCVKTSTIERSLPLFKKLADEYK